MVGNLRFAPVVENFREAVSIERERVHNLTKRIYRDDAKEFYAGAKISDDDVAMFMKTIRGRMTRQVNDNEWDAFMGLLNSVCGHSPTVCKKCSGAGILFESGDYVNRCRCPIGRNDPRRFPISTHP